MKITPFLCRISPDLTADLNKENMYVVLNFGTTVVSI